MASLLKGNPQGFELTEENRGLIIWRYIDLFKFIDLLEKEALFFANIHTFEDKFEACLSQVDLDEKKCYVCIDDVKYIDYKNDSALGANSRKQANACSPVFSKRKTFKHENELRAMLLFIPDSNSDDITGYPIKVNLTKLINKIYLSPYYSDFEIDAIKSIVRKCHPEMVDKMVQSDLLKRLY